MLFAPGLAVTAGLLTRFQVVGGGICLIDLFTPVLGLCAVYLSVRAWHVDLSDGRLLTARTISGRRTLDLGALRRVGRIELSGRGRPTDRLVLTDAHGVRIAVDRLRDGTKADMVLGAAPDGWADHVVVSKRAAARLFSQLQHGPHPLAEEFVTRYRGKGHAHAGPSEGTAWLPFLPLLLAVGCLLLAGVLLAVSLSIAGGGH